MARQDRGNPRGPGPGRLAPVITEVTGGKVSEIGQFVPISDTCDRLDIASRIPLPMDLCYPEGPPGFADDLSWSV